MTEQSSLFCHNLGFSGQKKEQKKNIHITF
jgi:hypothetical protein